MADQTPGDRVPLNELYTQVRDFLLGEPLPPAEPGTATEWVRLASWSDGQLIAVFVLVALVLGITAWNLRRIESWGARIGLFVLRAAVICVLLFAFYQPALLEERRARSTNTIIVLADDSSSMALPHAGGTRRDLIASFVREHAHVWRGIEEQNIIESYRFSDTLQPTDWRDMDKALVARGDRTRLVEVLEELRDRYRNRDIGGILILSDGIDNGRAGRILRQGNDLDNETVRLLEGFGAPIHTFGLEDDSMKDVSVHDLRYSPFAFKRNSSTIEAEIRVHGYPAGLLEVELLEEGQLVRSVTRQVKRGVTRYTASFDFTPEELGHRVYAVRVKAFEGEVTLENNERYAVIRVNRDKIRVLQIAGHPSWDVRFLRNHLKRTPNIQLISFFILINTGSTLGTASSRETSLIPFPAEELFVRELGGFDLVILQDFNYGPFSTPKHLHRVRDYVRDGGALVMVGGRLSLGAGGYDGTELAEILPVDLEVPDFSDDALDNREFKPELTEAGRTHTVTQLSYDPAENLRIWEVLPPLEGINKTRGPLHGGLVLARHPTLKTPSGKGMPVITVGEPGHGRTAVVATDSVWRWKMPHVGAGGDAQVYDRFWRNLFRWLIKDPDLDLVRANPSSGVCALGDSVDVEVRVFKPDYRPAPGHDFSIRVRRRPRAGRKEAPVVFFEKTGLRTDDTGRWAITLKPKEAGIYDVEVRAPVAGRQLVARSVFVVSDERPEMREVLPEGRLLDAVARATGGSARTLAARSVPLNFNPPRVSDVTSRRYHERWNVPAVFLLACLLFGLEWWARRKVGFL